MFAERLKLLRGQKDVTQKEIATLLGITQQAVGLYETNKRQPDPDTLNRLANYFGTTVDYLLGRTDNPAAPSASPTDRLADIPGLIRLRFANSKVPKNLKDYHVNSILTTIEFLEKLEKEETQKE